MITPQESVHGSSIGFILTRISMNVKFELLCLCLVTNEKRWIDIWHLTTNVSSHWMIDYNSSSILHVYYQNKINSVNDKKVDYQFHVRQLDIQSDNSNIVYASPRGCQTIQGFQNLTLISWYTTVLFLFFVPFQIVFWSTVGTNSLYSPSSLST